MGNETLDSNLDHLLSSSSLESEESGEDIAGGGPSSKVMGKADGLRSNVLTFVTQESYDRAIKELQDFMSRSWEFPMFIPKVERYLRHAIDLIYAIRAKKQVASNKNLTVSKQQELQERYSTHYKELENVLKKVERTYYDLKQQDIRSTVLIVKALVNSAILIAAVAFLIEIFSGLMQTTFVVVDDLLIRTVDKIFRLIGM